MQAMIFFSWPPLIDLWTIYATYSEEKLLKLLEELDGNDLQEVVKQMEEEEFHASIEGKLPAYNTRVKLPQTQRDLVYGDEDEDRSLFSLSTIYCTPFLPLGDLT